MMQHKSSGPKCDKIFNRISSGRSFSDVGALAITYGSEHSSFLQQNDSNIDALCAWSYKSSKILKHK